MMLNCTVNNSLEFLIIYRKRGDFKKIVDEGEKEFQEPIKKDLLK